MKITIVFDNYLHNPELKTEWGFSCLIEGFEKNILFDTGSDGEILLENMQKLKLDPKKTDA
jgi:7,8-dihydropterin-6-yl-methyl-4-(beta-D-ribofuranosyl)aminobenzene 5'-phosphate synthase